MAFQSRNLSEGFKFCPYDGYKFASSDSYCLICKRKRDNLLTSVDPPKKTSKKWSKVLFKQQGTEDNYYDSSFLSSLVQKNDRSNIHLKELIEKTLDVTWAINEVSIFLLIFYFMHSGTVYEGVLISTMILVAMVCTFLYIVFSKKIILTQTIFKNIKRALILFCSLYLLSPIMKTVNETYADNTTYALSIGLIVYHLIFREYSSNHKLSPKEWTCDSSTLASYAFSSFLASRLSNDFQVFTLLFSCLNLFFFSPFFRRAVKDYSSLMFKSLNVIATIVVFISIFSFSKLLGFTYLLAQIFITFICPMWLIWLYQYKRTFHGPWDLPEGINVKN